MNRLKLTHKMKKSVRWVFDVTKWEPTESELLLATACIQPEEKTRLARFVFKKDFKSSLIGRLLMRKFVCENHTGLDYNKIRFVRDEHGKPLLNGNSGLSFNVSHQGDLAVLAGEVQNLKLGVDVMKEEYAGGKSVTEFFRIMNRNFSAHEWTCIKGSGNETEQIAMFCRHWCLKESYVKAIGVGITINLQDISFNVKTKKLSGDQIVDDTRLYIKGVKQNWNFQEMQLNSHHCVAVATNEHVNADVLFKEIAFDDLIKGAVPLLEQDIDYCKAFYKKLEKV